MILYTMPASRFGTRLNLQVLVKDLDIERRIVPWPLPDWYKDVNPANMIPALDTGNRVIVESAVIAEYLEDVCDGPSLRPDDPEERAVMRLLIRVLDLYAAPPLELIHRVILKRKTRNGAETGPFDHAQVQREIDDGFAMMAPYMSGGRYAVGDRLSLADLAIMPILLHYDLLTPRCGLQNPVARAPFDTYFRGLSEEPAIMQVFTEMRDRLAVTLRNASFPEPPR